MLSGLRIKLFPHVKQKGNAAKAEPAWRFEYWHFKRAAMLQKLCDAQLAHFPLTRYEALAGPGGLEFYVGGRLSAKCMTPMRAGSRDPQGRFEIEKLSTNLLHGCQAGSGGTRRSCPLAFPA